MSDYAYLDKQKHIKVFAKECTANDLNKDFYCPDPNCKSVVHLYSFNSNKVKPYFKGYNHNEDCSFYKNNTVCHIEDFNTKDFSPLNLLSYIVHSSNAKKRSYSKEKSTNTFTNVQKSNKYIHSIKALYYLAINNPIYEEINGYKISDLVCFNKTSHIYTKYITGIKLIVCKFYRYDSKNKCIYFRYQSKDNTIIIKTNFDDINLYSKIKNEIYGYQGNILIFSNWKSDKANVYTTITKHKQITISK